MATAEPAGAPRDWTRTEGPGGAVRYEVRVPPRRRPGLAVWAAFVLLANVVAAAICAAGLAFAVAVPAPGTGPAPSRLPLVAGAVLGLLVTAPRLPGALRLAGWRLRGRETVEIAGGRLRVRRSPCTRDAAADLDVSRGAFVGAVGDVDRFLVRATRWRTGRWFRRDDVPGLGVGSVRVSTPEDSVHLGLSLAPEDAAALAADLARVPGLGPDRSPVPGTASSA